jgi:enoyl-CoA hydratase/carnithine racemase
MSEIMHVTRQQSTLTLSFHWDVPEAEGRLVPALVDTGIAQLKLAERDDTVRCIIIAGNALNFCRGRDPSSLSKKMANKSLDHDIKQFCDWIEVICNFPKPIIAAVEGGAHDAGFALALACDYIIASNSAQFSTSQMRLGLPPDGGISWMLSRQLPRQLVAELLFEGKPILAARLHQLGLVNQVVETGMALSSASAYAQKLAELPPLALERVKSLINDAPINSLAQQFDAERHAVLECLHHHEAQEGIHAYLTHNKPRF